MMIPFTMNEWRLYRTFLDENTTDILIKKNTLKYFLIKKAPTSVANLLIQLIISMYMYVYIGASPINTKKQLKCN